MNSSLKAALAAVIAAAMCLISAAPVAAQTAVFEESFTSGLGSFSESGRVYTGSYGVRLRGGGTSTTAIQSPAINLSGQADISVAYDRDTSGLDGGESLTVAYSVSGGSYSTLESGSGLSGRAELELPPSVDGETITLRFTLLASSFFEAAVIDDIVVTAGGDDDDDDDDGGELPPVDRIDANGPLNTTQHRNAGPGGDGWVVHPTNLGAGGLDHPIFIWGPGGGTGPAEYDWFFDRLASHGFVIYSEVSSGNGGEMVDAIDWLIAENNRPGSRYYQNLDTSSIAAGGHSMGSITTFAMADDPRLTTTIHVAGGSFDGNGPDNLRNPAIYIAGENDTLATGNVERDYESTDDVPVFFTIMDGVGHIDAAREGMPMITAWLRWHLGDEDFRSDAFLSPLCDFCTGIYDSESKNW